MGSIANTTELLGNSAANTPSQLVAPTKKNTTVSITLDADVYEYYAAKAKEDDRSLAKYLQRELKAKFEVAE